MLVCVSSVIFLYTYVEKDVLDTYAPNFRVAFHVHM